MSEMTSNPFSYVHTLLIAARKGWMCELIKRCTAVMKIFVVNMTKYREKYLDSKAYLKVNRIDLVTS